METVGGLDITAVFGKRKPHCGQGEWHVATRNKKNRRVSPLPPTARGCARLGGGDYFAEIQNCDHADFAEIAEVGGKFRSIGKIAERTERAQLDVLSTS